MSIKRRLPALVAAFAIAGGLAVSTAGVAGAATGEPAKCASSNGKYHATLVKSFKIMGRDSEGNVTERGGTLQVYRSAKCETVWARTVKVAKYNDTALETGVGITYYDVNEQRTIRVYHSAPVVGALETEAVHAGWHGTAWVEGGFVGDYQFDLGHNVRF